MCGCVCVCVCIYVCVCVCMRLSESMDATSWASAPASLPTSLRRGGARIDGSFWA